VWRFTQTSRAPFFKPQPERTTSGLMHPNALRSGMVQDTRHSAMALHVVCKSAHNLPPFQECDGARTRANFPHAPRTVECRNFAQLILTRLMQK
jgi:hypothetical protein